MPKYQCTLTYTIDEEGGPYAISEDVMHDALQHVLGSFDGVEQTGYEKQLIE